MDQLQAPPWFEEQVRLADVTYYRIGAATRWLARPRTWNEVVQTVLWARENEFPIAVIGMGSNIVFSDHFFDGVVLVLEKLNQLFWETPEVLYVEAGLSNTAVAEACLAEERDGGAWLFRLPGQIGAMVRMNARCFGREASHVVSEVVTIDRDGCLATLPASQVFLGYKETSLMKQPRIIVGARLVFPNKKSWNLIRQEMDWFAAERERTHQFDFPSCGSTFKNNRAAGKPSGQIFEELGFKGSRIGDAEVSETHANFIWNRGNATALDVLSLAAAMREKALIERQATLELEVEPIGRFESNLLKRCAVSYWPDLVHSESAWAGLFWHPQQKLEVCDFPKEIFAGRFSHYYLEKQSQLSPVTVRMEQLVSLETARAYPQVPFMRWTTYCDEMNTFELVPQDPLGTFCAELWHHSVSELFIADKNGKYLEFELTPQGHWLAIAFDGVRCRAVGHEKPTSAKWSGLRRFGDDKCFGMTFSYEQIFVILDCAPLDEISFQCALSLGKERYFLAPAWPEKTVFDEASGGKQRADFHQPARFLTVRFH